jgi:hypothetical protein
VFALAALVLFVLAAFGVKFESVGIVEIGLACLAAHFLIDFRPWSGVNFSRTTS